MFLILIYPFLIFSGVVLSARLSGVEGFVFFSALALFLHWATRTIRTYKTPDWWTFNNAVEYESVAVSLLQLAAFFGTYLVWDIVGPTLEEHWIILGIITGYYKFLLFPVMALYALAGLMFLLAMVAVHFSIGRSIMASLHNKLVRSQGEEDFIAASDLKPQPIFRK